MVAAEAEFRIGARASCSDGSCGEVRRLIIDPATDTVTHLVIQPGHRRETGRLVPVQLVDTSAGEIRLRCTLAQFDQLDHAEEFDLVEGPMPGNDDFIGDRVEYGTSDTAYAPSAAPPSSSALGRCRNTRGRSAKTLSPWVRQRWDPVTVFLPSMATSAGCRASLSTRAMAG